MCRSDSVDVQVRYRCADVWRWRGRSADVSVSRYSCGALSLGHSCGSLSEEALAGHSFGTLLIPPIIPLTSDTPRLRQYV